MASNKIFIYQDDKENGILTKKVEAKSGVFGNENRTKLATITNVRKNDENALAHKNLKLKTGNAVPFQDKNLNVQNENAAIQTKAGFSIALDTSTSDFQYYPGPSAPRNPLGEIQSNHSKNATPMSVFDSTSPMSVDKSIQNDELCKETPIKSLKRLPKLQRDTFYEVVEYQADIVKYLKSIEGDFQGRSNYMRKQPDINDSMRSILVDWLVEVSEEYKLQGETLCLAINYIDRFLSFMSVVRAKLQLVGTAAMLIASKYEEIYPPEIGEFVYITDDTYTKVQVLRMEKLLLKVLSFDLSAPTTYSFTSMFCVMLNYSNQVKFLTQYLCELSLLNASPFLNYKPSQISTAAMSLARYTLGGSLWTSKMTEVTGYNAEDLKEVIAHLNDLHNQTETLQQQAIQEKFKSNKYLQVSLIKPKRLTVEMIDEIINSEDFGDELNTTAENIENLKTIGGKIQCNE